MDINNECSNFIINFHFPITGVDINSGKESVLGSCTLLKFSNRFFLVTASHVMNERHHVKDNILWLWNYSDGSKVAITEDIIGTPGLDVPDAYDIAIVELNMDNYSSFDNEEFFNKCFLSSERIVNYFKLNDEEQSVCVVAGYASSLNKIVKNNIKKPRQTMFYTEFVEDKKESSDSIPFLTMKIKWDKVEDGKSLPKPQGISGGGVWLLSETSSLNPRFGGVVVAYNKLEKCVIAVKSAQVLALMKIFFPDIDIDLPSSILAFGTETTPVIMVSRSEYE